MNKLSVIIPARNEADNLKECISEISKELTYHSIDFEILIIDDGSEDKSVDVIKVINQSNSSVKCIKNYGENGFGRAVRLGLENFTGDAVAIMMADLSIHPKI